MITIFQNLSKQKGSSLTFSAQGGRGKEKNLSAGKMPAGSEGEAEGGCGENSASPEPKRSPAALIVVQSRTQQKSFFPFTCRQTFNATNGYNPFVCNTQKYIGASRTASVRKSVEDSRQALRKSRSPAQSIATLPRFPAR